MNCRGILPKRQLVSCRLLSLPVNGWLLHRHFYNAHDFEGWLQYRVKALLHLRQKSKIRRGKIGIEKNRLIAQIADASKKNDIVLDPFGGSGTTLLAAHRTGRRAYAIELAPPFVDEGHPHAYVSAKISYMTLFCILFVRYEIHIRILGKSETQGAQHAG